MALIGTIAINMKVSTAALIKGIAKADRAILAFGQSIKNSGFVAGFGSIIGEIGKSFAWAAGGVLSFARDSQVGLMRFSAVVRGTLKGVGESFGNAFGPMFGVVGRVIGALGKMGSTILNVGIGALSGLLGVAQSLVSSFVNLAKHAALFGAILGGIAAAAIWNVAQGAIALAEQSDRARIVFGKFGALVTDEANRMAVAFGVSRREFIQAASAFGTIFEGAKYGEEDAAKLSVHFTKLATDLSSLVHIPVQDAMEKIQSGLAGQIRPLREVGVFMTEAEVETYAYAHGIAKLNAELTESQKVQARIGFITEALAKANGNLAATADGAGNTVRGLTGRFENLKDEIGVSLLKVLVPAMQEISVGIQAATNWFEQMGIAANATTAGVLGGAQAEVQAIGWVQKSIMYVVDAWQTVKAVATGVILTINGAVISLLNTLRSTIYTMAELTEKFGGTKASVITEGFEKGVQAVQDMRRGLLKLEQQQAGAPKASIAVADAFERARGDIAKAREDLAKTPALNVNALKPNVPAEAAKVEAPKFAAAALAGSQSATNAILKSRYGAGMAGADPAKEVAKNTREANSLLKQAIEGINAMAGRQIGQAGGAINALLTGNF